jgi:hypothetical protein
MTSSPCVEYYKQQKQQLHCEEYRYNVTHNTFIKFHKKHNTHISQFNTTKTEEIFKTTIKKNTLSHVEKQIYGRSYSYKVHKIND